MKKIHKKIVTILSVVALTFTIASPALAEEYVCWYDSEDAWFKPYSGNISFQRTYVSGTGLKWSAEQIAQVPAEMPWHRYIELEFRPYAGSSTSNGPVDIDEIYDITYSPNLVSNLPNAYKEFSSNDLNDVSIGTYGLHQRQADYAYNSFLYLAGIAPVPNTYHALVEFEYGTWYVADGMPELLAQRNELIPLGSSITVNQ